MAFTRAKEKLILTYANEYAGKRHSVSQFLQEADYKKSEDINFVQDLNELVKEESKIERAIEVEKEDRSKVALSPSALLLFANCQKEFEYKYVYNMPEKKTISWDAIRLGSFVHLILEKGVKDNYQTLKEFTDYAKVLHLEEDWESVNLQEALHIIKVFFARNKGKYCILSKTEQFLRANIEGINFVGFADRIDFDANGEIEIVDYKTGKSVIEPRARNWQLGYYALAASKLGKVRRITLDMLKHDLPLEFELDDQGNARAINSSMEFNIYDVQHELVETAKKIHEAYLNGFRACAVEKNCEFCNEFVHNL